MLAAASPLAHDRGNISSLNHNQDDFEAQYSSKESSLVGVNSCTLSIAYCLKAA